MSDACAHVRRARMFVCARLPVQPLKSHEFPCGPEDTILRLNHSRCSEPNRPFKNVTRFSLPQRELTSLSSTPFATVPAYKTAPYAAVSPTLLMLNQDFLANCVLTWVFEQWRVERLLGAECCGFISLRERSTTTPSQVQLHGHEATMQGKLSLTVGGTINIMVTAIPFNRSTKKLTAKNDK